MGRLPQGRDAGDLEPFDQRRLAGPLARGDGPAAFTLIPRPVNLQLHVPQHAPGEVHYWISSGIPGTAMPAWGDADPATGKPRLSDEDRWSIIRYLLALSRGETP